ncbi:uncharacterized protein LOC127136264 [Lathyrus oleraceus]|uniref:uncharacterized protein LOC127136264 n=1 Tax=Pisum sativum TaxID=3888 RepID=UPI0021D31678|nr:uncharacterized protein LOC127136264 [Pisum sativum]
MKRKREPSDKNKKKKALKLGESSASQKKHVPLSSSTPYIPKPTSLTLVELHATTESEKTQYVPEPSEPIPPPSEPTPEPSETIPPPYEPISEPSELTHNPSEPTFQLSEPDLTFPTIDEAFSKWMTSEVFKLKGLSKQVINDYIREAKERLEARLPQEVTERAMKEAKERDDAKEEDEKDDVVEVEVEAEEAARKAAEEAAKSFEITLTRSESSTSDLAPIVLKTLEDLQKEHQLVIARLDQRDQVNSSIQTLLSQLLQRMPPPPNP